MGDIYELRRWMYRRKDDNGGISEEFLNGLEIFMAQASSVPTHQRTGFMVCPCRKCKNCQPQKIDTVGTHLFNRGFTPEYYVWFYHGEGYEDETSGSTSYQPMDQGQGYSNEQYDGHQFVIENDDAHVGLEHNRFEEMVTDAFPGNVDEEPNVDAQKFYDMLDSAKQPIYEGCREGLSKLSLASRMMTIKSDHNQSESSMDDWASLIKDYLPEGNQAAESYYDINKLVSSLGLPSQMIDVCIDNCMIFWKDDEDLQECRFCHKPRFKPQGAGRKVPYQRMWYLPITDRLQRLYHSERTSASMRWHAEHSTPEGEVHHPSDAKAWKHFNSVHSNFANEKRNVYLGLCTDGFSPFGMSGRQYSLWPVILTPYNLPPYMCMQREFLFLSILIPGPKHPRRSIDVFLQPLIHELNMLWSHGVRTFDYSRKRNFTMRAVLMWTISDFPAYGMLSGWTTHGRLSCPYCQNATDAFQLKNGRKSCWFDCHRRFLPMNHPYRGNRRLFAKGKRVRIPPPPYLSGEQIEGQLDYWGAQETAKRGGNWFNILTNLPDGYLEEHNWHKKSIFWDLPYWKDHLLRHNLDVMHIEKNFFDNIMHTILNVPGRSKDNLKSRLDLPLICSRVELHLTGDGRAPVPTFRLSSEGKATFFNWVSTEVKFPDGYVSNLCKSVEQGKKFAGMKSHDCHVFMQRLLPFAFAELLPTNVHEALAGVGAFFRDLCVRTLTQDGIQQLNNNIPILLCNLEKIFPPSFFDVMEHLPVHLPHEADLGGPVQFRWMYPFERFMKDLKGKAKNLARVEGSIVAGSLTEETSNFCSYYFPPPVRTRKRAPRRNDDGGITQTYPVSDVPDIFCAVGRQAGIIREEDWSSFEDYNCAFTYILLQCEEVSPFLSEFIRQVYEAFPNASADEIEKRKDQHFAKWLRTQVDYGDTSYPVWFRELIQGPLGKVMSSPMYFTRGYVFHTFEHGKSRATANFGVVVQAGDTDFYGIIQDIIQVQFPGLINLKCTLFKCEWFDPVFGRGVRVGKFGVTDVNGSRSYAKYDPFVLASQADQVCFIPYPRVRKRGIPWLSVLKIAPRGMIVQSNDAPLQNETAVDLTTPEADIDNIILIDPQNREAEILPDADDAENPEDEFANERGESTDEDDDNSNDDSE